MLNRVPEQTNKAARAVTLRHPNSMECFVLRKVILREEEPELGGLPSVGGMGLFDSEDEADVDWVSLGYGALLMCTTYQQSSMNDRSDGVDLSYPLVEAMIELTIEKSDPEYDAKKHKVKKHDVVYIILTDDVKIAFEVVGIQGNIDIPPFSVRFQLEKRDDLTYIDGFPSKG